MLFVADGEKMIGLRIHLPGWMFNAVLWHFQIFSGTNVGIMIFLHLFTGYVLSYYHHVRLESLYPLWRRLIFLIFG